MDKKELIKCIDFFREIKVTESDVTTEQERTNHMRVVIVNYTSNGKSYTTNKLYYKNILHQVNVKNPQNIINYFGGDVFWLDNNINQWPKGSGEGELENTIIDEMVEGDDKDFKALLKSIANNNKTGFIQRITVEGKPGQYHHNFENNNHWHDIILLIQAIINNKGEKVDKRYFSRLVFKWDGDKNTQRERSSLAKEVEGRSRSFIDNLYNNIKSLQNTIADMEITNILKQKGQIILQGPPGTGKTYTAKDIAEQIIFSNVSADKKQQKELLESTEQFKLIQFHPAYSYEDFVRGIVAESKDNQIDYVTKDKILAKFAKEAYKNWKASTEPKEKVAKETWVQNTLEDFKDFLSEEIEDKDEKLMITGKAYINRITENSIRYNSDAWEVDGGVPVSDIVKMYLADATTRKQIKDNPELTKTAKSLATYWLKILELFRKYISDNKLEPPQTIAAIEEKKFVLIIDEINRANLPAVLGELIYALEYRGEKVESMYAIDDDNTIIIPPNLFIIGTMNTSDRSVGHIDYAIRRRFAFIDVLPKILEGDNFEIDLFKQVSDLFIKNFDAYVQDNTVELKLSEHLSEEFRPEDVWLGHSYFIKGDGDFDLRKKFEIIPILKEYVKDGILKQSAEQVINTL